MKEELERLRQEALRQHIPVMRPRTASILCEELQRKKPKEILEIGTCVGLGVITMLLACDGKVTSLEIDEDRYFRAKENIEKFGLSDRCRLILGDCKEVLPCMEKNRYDFVVFDGPKSFYRDAYSLCKSMLTERGEIFADDVDFYGLTDGKEYPDRKHRTNVMALRKFLTMTAEDADVTCRRIDVEDGVLIVEKK